MAPDEAEELSVRDERGFGRSGHVVAHVRFDAGRELRGDVPPLLGGECRVGLAVGLDCQVVEPLDRQAVVRQQRPVVQERHNPLAPHPIETGKGFSLDIGGKVELPLERPALSAVFLERADRGGVFDVNAGLPWPEESLRQEPMATWKDAPLLGQVPAGIVAFAPGTSFSNVDYIPRVLGRQVRR